MAPLGAAEVKVMLWLPLPTAKDCWSWGAAAKLALPAWLASMTQVPAAWKLTTPAEIEQTPVLVVSTVRATVRPEVAEAAGL